MFDLLVSDVFQKALLGGTAAAAMAAVVGYFLVLRMQAFAAEAFSRGLAHSSRRMADIASTASRLAPSGTGQP